MKNRFLFVILSLFIIGNSSLAQDNTSNQTRSIQLISTFPFSFHQINGEWVYSDTITIFYQNDTIMYRIPHYNSFTYGRLVTTGDDDEIETDSIVTSVGYKYFVYKKGATKGLWLTDTGRIDKEMYDHPDSVTRYNNLNSGIESYQTIIDSTDHAITVDSTGFRIMKFVSKNHVHNSGSRDTIFIYLGDRFHDIDYSFSNELEKIYNKKIERVRVHAQCDPPKDSELTPFEMKLDWQLEKTPVSILEQASRFFAMASRYRQ